MTEQSTVLVVLKDDIAYLNYTNWLPKPRKLPKIIPKIKQPKIRIYIPSEMIEEN